MDEVWVPNNDLANSLEKDKLNPPIKIIPHCFNIENYTKKYSEINIDYIKNTFKFYYIGDLNDRKNIRSIIRAFHSEFDRSEPVSLIFKIKKFGLSPQETSKFFDSILVEEKKKLRLYKNIDSYIKEIVISENASDEQIYSLHQYGDCFLCPSHGEAWSIPSFEAMAFGNTPICSNFGGPKDFIDKNNVSTGSCIDGVYSICQCEDAAFPDIFTGREYWFQPCEKSVREKMRFYYENKDKKKNVVAGLTRAKEFSYENIGNKIKEILNENN
jgi:glycosyltransferase involved in cell wall biosynthesis